MEATHLLAPVLQDFHHQHSQTLSKYSPTLMSLLLIHWRSPGNHQICIWKNFPPLLKKHYWPHWRMYVRHAKHQVVSVILFSPPPTLKECHNIVISLNKSEQASPVMKCHWYIHTLVHVLYLAPILYAIPLSWGSIMWYDIKYVFRADGQNGCSNADTKAQNFHLSWRILH